MTAGRFKWIAPEVYPLAAAMGAALLVCGYSITRNLLHNPEVFVSKKRRLDAMKDDIDSDAMHRQSKAYNKGFLRSLAESRKGHMGIFPNSSE